LNTTPPPYSPIVEMHKSNTGQGCNEWVFSTDRNPAMAAPASTSATEVTRLAGRVSLKYPVSLFFKKKVIE
jgi:hypothetical protein